MRGEITRKQLIHILEAARACITAPSIANGGMILPQLDEAIASLRVKRDVRGS